MDTIDFSSQNVDVNFILYSAPGYIYWKDLNLVYLGCNRNFLDIIGLNSVKDIIGKTDYDMPWGKSSEMVEKYNKDDKYVIESGNKLLTEDQSIILQSKNNVNIMVQTAKTPLIDKYGNVVGVLGTAINITNIKEAERLKLENQTQAAKLKAEFKRCLEEIQYSIQSYKIHVLNNKLGVKAQPNEPTLNIKLTKRERDILYYLSLNKPPKEIAAILSILEKKSIAPNTIQSIINKQLYLKFQTYNISDLIEKANMLRLIPCLPDN